MGEREITVNEVEDAINSLYGIMMKATQQEPANWDDHSYSVDAASYDDVEVPTGDEESLEDESPKITDEGLVELLGDAMAGTLVALASGSLAFENGQEMLHTVEAVKQFKVLNNG